MNHPDIMCLVEAWLSDKPHCVWEPKK